MEIIFHESKIEYFVMGGIGYFNPYDIGKALGIQKTTVRDNVSKMNDNQVKKFRNSDVDNGDIRKLNNAGENFLTESGVFKMIFRSRSPLRDELENFITDEVLPDIRKYGMYMSPSTLDNILEDPDLLVELATKYRDAKAKLDETRKELEKAKPKAEYTNRVLNSKNALLVTQIAKDYGMSAIKFNELLHELKIQYKRNSQWVLYQDYAGKGYTKSKTTIYDRGDGSEGAAVSTLWTQKGRKFLYDKIKKETGKIPPDRLFLF
jgi:phage antirepressor YoqD-like protein